jgi:hypothetical protein
MLKDSIGVARMYKIHVGHRKPEPNTLGSHIFTENDPVSVTETKEEAREVMRTLIARGTKPGEIYAVGFDPLVSRDG